MTKFPDPPGRAVTPIYAIRHQSSGLELRILGFVPRYVTLGLVGVRVQQLRAQDHPAFKLLDVLLAAFTEVVTFQREFDLRSSPKVSPPLSSSLLSTWKVCSPSHARSKYIPHL